MKGENKMTFNNTTWNESEHPRDDEGKFTYKNGSCTRPKSIQDMLNKEKEEKARMQRAADILYPTMKDDKNGGMHNINKNEVGKLGGDICAKATEAFENTKEKVKDIVFTPNTYSQNEDYKEIHDVCKKVSIEIYNKNSKETEIAGFKKREWYANKKTGFYSQLYVNEKAKEIIIAYEGTNILSGKDIANDIQMYNKKEKPLQFKDAEIMYKNVMQKYPKYSITFTGHSLGGSIAQLMGAKYKHQTVTFNAYGIGQLNGLEINSTKNIINYAHRDDGVFNEKRCWHIGKVIYTYAGDNVFLRNNKLGNHKIENIGNLKMKVENPY